MPYTTKTNPDEMTFGTSLQGYITAPYAELVELFGEPHDFFDDFNKDGEAMLFQSVIDDNMFNSFTSVLTTVD